jgi:hypothetical protein
LLSGQPVNAYTERMQLHTHPEAPWIHGALHAQTGRHYVRCDTCGVEGFLPPGVSHETFVAQHRGHAPPQASHYGLGDLVARATSAVGIKPCTPCEQRKQMLNGLFPRVWRR